MIATPRARNLASASPISPFQTRKAFRDRSQISLVPTACFSFFIEALIGDSTAAPNSSSWSNHVRSSKGKASASPRSATIPRRLSSVLRRSIRFESLCSPIGIAAVIRDFGILNTNIAPGLRAHGVPHPVEYLIAPDGVVVRKYFVANYQHRVTASAIVFREFGVAGDGAASVTLRQRRAHCGDWTFCRKIVRRPGNQLFCEIHAPTRMARLR